MSTMVLYPNCFPVKGYSRSVICDLNRNKYDFIPNALYEWLVRYNRKEIGDIQQQHPGKEEQVFTTYLQFLRDKEYIFFTDEPELFPEIEMAWEDPALITNAIIDFDRQSNHDLPGIIEQLAQLRCFALEMRTFDPLDMDHLRGVIAALKHSGFRSVQLLLKYHPDYTMKGLKELVFTNQRIISIIVHSTPHGAPHTTPDADNVSVFFIRNEISSESHCGVISKFNFACNISLFMESHFHNNCLNRKISISKQGYIKNCPSMEDHYGHHKHTKLVEALGNPAFKKYWNISRDQVEVCKDCEFRYMCTDCRAYSAATAAGYGKPLKCAYDPYTATWKDN